MKKPWSITTTTRSPYRLREQLFVLRDNFVGVEWTRKQQINFQITLIQCRLYGHTEDKGFSAQFLKGLSDSQVSKFTDFNHALTFEEASDIFDTKNYKDPAMRGRQSFNPFKKFGFVRLRNKVLEITPFGRYFLSEEFDLSEIFFRSFIRWQIPNIDNDDYGDDEGYNIKPFLGVLHLINLVNNKSIRAGEDPKGISKQEFSLFAPTLVNYLNIEDYADKIIDLRLRLHGRTKAEQKSIFDTYSKDFAREFLQSTDEKLVSKLLKNLKDYGDNAIRYFRLTRYIYIRGGGYYVDLEKRRRVEIDNLLRFDDGKAVSFESKEAYLDFVGATNTPVLPWETREKFIEILEDVVVDVRLYENKLQQTARVLQDYSSFSEGEIKKLISELRSYRRELQEKENHVNSQGIDVVKSYVDILEDIFKQENKPLALEKYTALSLHALNDAINIQPNYPVGDDNEPTFTAPAGKPDIECYYQSFNAICEVTMLTGRDQWYNEGQPIMRHLRDFEEKNIGKPTYCLFISPSMHRDTLNTFWISVKYEYEGRSQKIIPLSIKNFTEIMKTLIQIKENGKVFQHADLVSLYEGILLSTSEASDVNEWFSKIPNSINEWKSSLIS